MGRTPTVHAGATERAFWVTLRENSRKRGTGALEWVPRFRNRQAFLAAVSRERAAIRRASGAGNATAPLRNSTAHRYETGQTTPTGDTLAALALALRVSPGVLLPKLELSSMPIEAAEKLLAERQRKLSDHSSVDQLSSDLCSRRRRAKRQAGIVYGLESVVLVSSVVHWNDKPSARLLTALRCAFAESQLNSLRSLANQFRDEFHNAASEHQEIGCSAERFAHACDRGLALAVALHWFLAVLPALVHSRRGISHERAPLAQSAPGSVYSDRWRRLQVAVGAITDHGTRAPSFGHLQKLYEAVCTDPRRGLELLGARRDVRRCAEEILAVPAPA